MKTVELIEMRLTERGAAACTDGFHARPGDTIRLPRQQAGDWYRMGLAEYPVPAAGPASTPRAERQER